MNEENRRMIKSIVFLAVALIVGIVACLEMSGYWQGAVLTLAILLGHQSGVYRQRAREGGAV